MAVISNNLLRCTTKVPYELIYTSAANASTPSINISSVGIRPGDLIYVSMTTATTLNGTNSLSAPSGFTLLYNNTYNASYDSSLCCAYKVSNGSETIIYSAGSGDGGRTMHLAIFRGVNKSFPVQSPTSDSGSGGNINPPSYVPSKSGNYVIVSDASSQPLGNPNNTGSGTSTLEYSDIRNQSVGVDTEVRYTRGAMRIFKWSSGTFDLAQYTGSSSDSNYAWNSLVFSIIQP